MSARWSVSWPRACSGAMYWMVPTIAPDIVCSAARPAGSRPMDFPAPASAGPPEERAIPKSMISGSSSASIMMLAGFRSRCTTPASFAACNPATTPRAMRSTRPTGSFPSFARTVERSSPSTYGIVMYLMPLISPRSWMRTTFLWVTCLASSSSLLKRRSKSRAAAGSAATSGRTTFRATATPSSASQAW